MKAKDSGAQRKAGAARCRTFAIAVAAGAAFSAPEASTSQSESVEPMLVREAICETCSIDVSLSLSLGGDQPDDGLICVKGPMSAAVDADGRIYLGPGCDPHQFLEFAPTGKFIRYFGTFGQGPGKFAGISQLFVDARNRLLIYDAQLRRVLLDAERHLLAIQSVSRLPRQVAAGPDGATVENFSDPADPVGMPLHVVDSAGRIVRSFGVSGRRQEGDDRPTSQWRSLAGGRGQTIWAAHYSSYQMEEWDPAMGRLARVLFRRTPWFTVPGPGPDRGDAPWLASIRVDDSGYLWVLIKVPSAHGDVPDGIPAPWHARFDSILEVIHPEEVTVVASQRFDRMFGRWVGNRLTSLEETAAGEFRFELWEVVGRIQQIQPLNHH